MNRFIGLFFLLILQGQVFAQRTFTMAEAINKRAMFAPATFRQIEWIPGSEGFSYTLGAKVARIQAKDLKADTIDLLKNINAALVKGGKSELPAMPLFKWLNPDELWFYTNSDVFTFSLSKGLTLKNSYPEQAEVVDYHAKTYQTAYRLDSALWVGINGQSIRVAKSEKDGIEYGKSVHREEFGIVKGTFWSNTGHALAFYRMDESMVTKYPIYVLDSMPATYREIRYPFAGATSHHVTVGVYNLKKQNTVYLQTGEPLEQYLTNVAWSADDQFIIVAVVNRAQNHLWLKQFNATTGAFVKTIFEETNDKWVEPEHPVEFVPGNNNQFVWQSERDGFKHLYLYDLDGKMLRQLSSGRFPITNFYGFSENGKQCFYQTADESGLNRYVWSVSIKDGKTNQLTAESGVHNAFVSHSGEWMVDVFSELKTPRLITLKKTEKNAKSTTLLTAKSPLEAFRIGNTQLVPLQSPDGTPLNARIIVPESIEPAKKYPAIIYVYNGPHLQMVTNSWLAGGEMWMHRMASLGYIVMVIDGRGSDNRGLAFEQAVFRHLGDFEMEDQLKGVQYLKNLGFIDSTRIGVYGWSYGGFMATSLLTRPEAKGAFKCGVAGGPVLDWRMYEIMYTERYMDTPQENPEGYKKNNLYNYIDQLNGRLLMIHGTSDNTVLWQHSLKYVQNCVRKGKQLDYFVYPEHEHNVTPPERAHLFEMIEAFFKDRL